MPSRLFMRHDRIAEWIESIKDKVARPGDALERERDGVVRENARGHFLGAEAEEQQVVILDRREYPDGRTGFAEEAEGGIRGHVGQGAEPTWSQTASGSYSSPRSSA